MVSPAWDSLEEKQRERLASIMAAYAGCIDSIDQNIGKLTAHLESLDQLDNTMIFFLSDNGACQEGGDFGKGDEAMVQDPPLKTTDGVRTGLYWANACNTPFRLYKHFVHEGGACTPMIAHWPAGIPIESRGSFAREFRVSTGFHGPRASMFRGQLIQRICHPAKVARSSHVSKERRLPFMKLQFTGNTKATRRCVGKIGNWFANTRSPWELFNIESDRTEMNNLADKNRGKTR